MHLQFGMGGEHSLRSMFEDNLCVPEPERLRKADAGQLLNFYAITAIKEDSRCIGASSSRDHVRPFS